MDFFAHQERARKQTTLMVGLFLAAVVCIVLSINVVGGIIYVMIAEVPVTSIGQALGAVPISAWWVTTAVVIGIIATGTLSRMHALSGGGAAVAEMVGARRVKRNSGDEGERRLLNIVEEMAIASGISVPQVYVMDDQSGINAFAAGYSPNEAAVTVTRGTLDALNRDELQGVVAHEFSHILNGDMRLNVRLMGVIAGIVMIGAMGRFAMRVGSGGGSSADDDNDSRFSSQSSSSSSSKGDLRIFLVGLAIWLIGAIGVLFGNLIKAAISRQREFLADASAVQFTRNPEGIGGALYRIGQSSSHVHQRHAEELSHMFFGESVNAMFATHPPIDERIERVMGPGAIHLLRDRIKRTDAAVEAARPGPVVEEFVSPLFSKKPAIEGAIAGFSDGTGTNILTITSGAMLASVGTLTTAHVQEARRLLDKIPLEVRTALGTSSGAKAALFALLLGKDEARARQLDTITGDSGRPLAELAARIADALAPLGPRLRLPVFELVVPALTGLDQLQRDNLLSVVTALIRADNKVSLAEFVLLTLCRRHFEKPVKGVPPVKHRTLQSAGQNAFVVLSLLSRASPQGEAALPGVVAALALGTASEKPASFALAMVETALYELKLLAPLKKPAFIKACLEIVMADGTITITEGELMRAICAALDSPLPPILEEQQAVA
jgi:Zn-dependent protease with chaperone function